MYDVIHPALVQGITPAERQAASQLDTEPAASTPALSGATAQTGGFASAAPPSNASAPLTGATAQTSGFAQAGSDLHSSGNPVQPPTSGFGGGLGSSPNVPLPGTSIDPATGKPHTAGLTRAELEAKKAQAAQGSTHEAVDKLGELSGREQAARQLTGTANEVVTPGRELPGGWGATQQVPVPGSSPSAPSTIYEDIGSGLERVGHAAYGLIPQGLKDAINPDHPLDKGKQPEGMPPKTQPSPVSALLENAKQQGEKLLHEVQESFASGSDRPNGPVGPDGSVLDQVKQFLSEAGSAAHDARLAAVVPGLVPQRKAGSAETVIAPVAGAPVPGIISAGTTSLPSQETQGALPGDSSKGAGALPGSSKEAGVALLPEEKAATGTEGGLVATGASQPPAQPISGSTTHTSSLAPPLPATHLGDGAAEGATALERADLPAEASSTTHATPARDPNDRATSTASITAIRDGHEGHRPSPLAESTLVEEEPSVSNLKATPDGDNTKTPSATISNAKSLTPGEESAGVGHPSSRGEGTTREPGTYPTPEHDAPVNKSEGTTATSAATSAAPASAVADDSAVSDHPAENGSPHAPANKQLDSVDNKGHQRTGSNASTGSNGKKKVGFMKKLKGEMKVLSGKMSHDEKKVHDGEAMKKGE